VTFSIRNRIVPRPCAAAAAIAAAALVLALPASAAQTDRDKPITFAGDSGDANLQARGGALTGNVVITQGTLSIRADRIVFKQNADNSLSATAYGNPVEIRQKREGVDEYYEGYAQRVEYDGTKDLVELFDRALLKRGQDEIRSNYVSYNTSTEVFKAEGRASTVPDPTGPGARVRGMFQPRSESTSKEKDKAKDGAKDSTKAGQKNGAKDGQKDGAKGATPPPSVTLRPAGDLVSPATK
jgi:lipopolysaccharide export system protein LptA